MAKKKNEKSPEVTQDATTRTTKDKAAKKKAVPEVEKEKEQEVREKRPPQMVTVNGDNVSNLHVFKSDRGDDWFITARINDVPLKPQVCSPEDCEAIMNKTAKAEELMQKYYPTKVMRRLSTEELKLPATFHDNGKEFSINKFNVYKEKNEENIHYGKYKLYADIDGKKMSVVAPPQLLNEYFDRVKTPAQMVAQVFGEQLGLKSHYEQFLLPEGVKANDIRIQKNKETNRYEISVDVSGLKSCPKEISYSDRQAFFSTKIASKEQLAAKYLGSEILQMQALMKENKHEMKQGVPSLGI